MFNLLLGRSLITIISTSQGFNSTLTESVDALGRNGQLKEIELKLHPDIKEPLKKICDDPKTTIVVLSGSDRTVLDDVWHFSPITQKIFFSWKLWLWINNFLCRTSKNTICGWQQKMVYFCVLQRENGWQQCLKIYMWIGSRV